MLFVSVINQSHYKYYVSKRFNIGIIIYASVREVREVKVWKGETGGSETQSPNCLKLWNKGKRLNLWDSPSSHAHLSAVWSVVGMFVEAKGNCSASVVLLPPHEHSHGPGGELWPSSSPEASSLGNTMSESRKRIRISLSPTTYVCISSWCLTTVAFQNKRLFLPFCTLDLSGAPIFDQLYNFFIQTP